MNLKKLFKKKLKKPLKKVVKHGFGGEILTEVDVMLSHLKQKKKADLNFFVKKFGEEEKLVEEWAKILESNGLITVDYTPFGKVVLKIVEEKKEGDVKEKKREENDEGNGKN